MIKDKHLYDLIGIQKNTIEILKQFISICNKESLQYYVLGGTMLGAIRHKGFIPWDDDIDVAMPRKDYDKFVNVAQKYLPENLFLQTYITDKDAPWNYAKIRDSKTTFIEKHVKCLDINHGIYIDVFPLDYYPTNKIKSIFFDIYNTILKYTVRFSLFNDELNFYKKLSRRILYFFLKIIYPNINNVIQRRDKLFKSVKKTYLFANHCGAWGKKEIAPIEWFGKGIDMQFENLIVKVPTHYDKWLTQVYGNYMQLPPKEKQISRHCTDIIDLENPYTKYIKRKK